MHCRFQLPLAATVLSVCFALAAACTASEVRENADAEPNVPPKPAAAPRATQNTVADTTLKSTEVFPANTALVELDYAADHKRGTPITFGKVFMPGQILPGRGAQAQVAGGTPVDAQLDVLRQHPDGSVRHGVVTLMIPAGKRHRSIQIRAGVEKPSQAVELAQLPASFDAVIAVNQAGRQYQASVRQLLADSIPREWLRGPLVTEWLLDGPLQTVDGETHPLLTARFAVRAYRGMERIRVDFVVENTLGVTQTATNTVYDVQLRLGDKTVLQETALKHFRQARWRHQSWWGEQPKFSVAPDLDTLTATGVIPRYDPKIRVPDGALQALIDSWANGSAQNKLRRNALMGTGLMHPAMRAGGDRPDIGPLPRWIVQYLLTGDNRAREAMLGTADRAGSFPVHYRDKVTGHPVSLADHPAIGLGGAAARPLLSCTGDCDVPNKPDSAHQPSMVFIPYVLTGDHYYLEELLFWSSFSTLSQSVPRRQYGDGLLRSGQLRDQAWSLRTLAQTDWIIPEANPLRTNFSHILQRNLDYYLQRYVGTSSSPPAAPNKLGILTEGTSFPPDRWYKTWMDDFFTWSAGYVVGLGYDRFAPMRDFKASSPVKRMTTPGFCWIFAAIDKLNFRDSPVGPVYDNYAIVYRNTLDSQWQNLDCASNAMAQALGLPAAGQMLRWRREEPRGFPLYMQIALATAVDAGIPGAAEAWARFIQQPASLNPSRYPEWSLVPTTATPAHRVKSDSKPVPVAPPAGAKPVPAIQDKSIAPVASEVLTARSPPTLNPAIRQLEPGRWLPISRNTIADVLPPKEVRDELYGWPIMIVNAWNSGAYNSRDNRLIVWGGGHAGWEGNEIYSFDVADGRWSRLTDPSDSPPAVHTYDQLEYVPGYHKLFIAGGSPMKGGASRQTWLFDFSTRRWTQMPDLPSTQWMLWDFYNTVDFDPVSKRLIWLGPHQSADFDPASGRWSLHSNPHRLEKNTRTQGAIDPQRRIYATLGWKKNKPDLSIYRLDDTGRVVSGRIAVTTSGATEIQQANNPGFEFDRRRRQFVAWAQGGDIYTLDPENWTWTRHAPTGTVNPGDPHDRPRGRYNGTFGRFQYMPDYDAFILVTGINEPVYVYKLP